MGHRHYPCKEDALRLSKSERLNLTHWSDDSIVVEVFENDEVKAKFILNRSQQIRLITKMGASDLGFVLSEKVTTEAIQ